jgi:hypothetical protein
VVVVEAQVLKAAAGVEEAENPLEVVVEEDPGVLKVVEAVGVSV